VGGQSGRAKRGRAGRPNVASYDRRSVDLSSVGVTDTPVCTRLSGTRVSRRLSARPAMLLLLLLML